MKLMNLFDNHQIHVHGKYLTQDRLPHLDNFVCFKNLDAFIKTVCYSYDIMNELHWVHSNKMKLQKSKVTHNSKKGKVDK